MTTIVENEGRTVGPPEFGTLLRSFRLTAGLSQEALAERAGLSAHGIRALERGYRRTPQRGTLALLSGALALSDEQQQDLKVAAARWVLLRGAGKASVTVGPWSDAPIPNLPLSLASFVGRERELDEIATMVRERRLVTLTGSGGIGKTQTALHTANALSEAGKVPVCFVGLAPIANPALVVAAVASTLGVQEVPTRPLLETLFEYLKNKTLLLILDNCEHVITEAAMAANALLAACPRLRILATSREPLRAAGERAYRLPSLRAPLPKAAHRLRASDIAEYGAIVLFTDRARAVDYRFVLTDENAPTVAGICRRLDGIPLAIELAAARVDVLSVKALAEKLDDRFRILTSGERTALPRQQTMRALFDWSHDLLDEVERRLFRRIGIFVNGFALEGAIAVASGEDFGDLDVSNVVESLVDKSLVLAELRGDAARYQLLESLRAYATEKLDAAGEHERVASRHLRYLLARFTELRGRYEKKAQDADLIAALQTNLEDVRYALDGALARSASIEGAELLVKIGPIWRAIGLETDGTARCEAYLAALPGSEGPLRVRLSILFSHLLAASGHKVRALDVATETVVHARLVGHASLLARALHRYASAAMLLTRYDEAERALEQAETISGKVSPERSGLLGARALLSQLRGDLKTAAYTFEQLRLEYRSLGNVRGEQIAAGSLAETEHARGQTQRAIAIVREMVLVGRASLDDGVLFISLQNLAGYLVAADDLPAAVAAAQEAIRLRAVREPDDPLVAVAIEHLGLVVALRDDLERAAILEGYADATIARHGFAREFTETTTYDRLTAILREKFAPDELARLSAKGAALASETAIALALEGTQIDIEG